MTANIQQTEEHGLIINLLFGRYVTVGIGRENSCSRKRNP
jgi:hypothetical protein